MKAINHRIISSSFLLFLEGSVLEVVYAFLMGSLPDQIETVGSKRVLKHRGFSHDIGLWLGLIAMTFLLPAFPALLVDVKNFPLKELLRFRTWVLFYPPFIHSLCDLLTPKGVPFLGVKCSLPLINHGTWKEYVLSLSLLLASLISQLEKLKELALSLCKRIFTL